MKTLCRLIRYFQNLAYIAYRLWRSEAYYVVAAYYDRKREKQAFSIMTNWPDNASSIQDLVATSIRVYMNAVEPEWDDER